jgi:hypothetical protein
MKIGTSGFEPLTPCTPSMCATRLRHVPILTNSKFNLFFVFFQGFEVFRAILL